MQIYRDTLLFQYFLQGWLYQFFYPRLLENALSSRNAFKKELYPGNMLVLHLVNPNFYNELLVFCYLVPDGLLILSLDIPNFCLKYTWNYVAEDVLLKYFIFLFAVMYNDIHRTINWGELISFILLVFRARPNNSITKSNSKFFSRTHSTQI